LPDKPKEEGIGTELGLRVALVTHCVLGKDFYI